MQNRYLAMKDRFDRITGEVVSFFFQHAMPTLTLRAVNAPSAVAAYFRHISA
jgi:hypothetical protein